MISVVVACMNRQYVLKHTISTWLCNEFVSEVVVVDWSSNPALDLGIKSDKLKIITHTGEKYFNLSKAYNMAIQHSTHHQIVKIDADHMLNPYNDYFTQNILKPGTFITGDHRIGKIRDKHGFLRYLNGFVHMYRQDFLQAGCYDERFIGYGYDDEDLYKRLRSINVEHVRIKNDPCCVFHIPHDDKSRHENYSRGMVFSARTNYNISKKHPKKVEHQISRVFHISFDKPAPYKHLPLVHVPAIDTRRAKRHTFKNHKLKLHPCGLNQQLYFSENPGAIGCFLSHYKVWQQIATQQLPACLITEHDACLDGVRDVHAHYSYYIDVNNLTGFDLIQFNKRGHLLQFPGDFNGTECYLLTYTGAKKLISFVHNRACFNNCITNKPPGGRGSWPMFRNEPAIDWNKHADCIVAAADTFIGMCSRVHETHPDFLRIENIPCVGLKEQQSTVFDKSMTRYGKPFWELQQPSQIQQLMNDPDFKWWEKI